MQTQPMQIGITGGIGVGKSMVCKIFQTIGIPIYDADSRAKTIMTTDGILVEQIKKEFGSLAYQADGALNRAYLAETVFANTEQLVKLNALVHPRVGIDYRQWFLAQQAPYVIREAALLYESGAYATCDKVIVVTAPLELRIARVLARDKHRTRKQVEDIIAKQLPEENKIGRADYIIYNNDLQPVLQQVLELHQQLITLNTPQHHE
ncbi:MAG: dephospho-CoA kinase [Cyclobacteriaceae bacterium]|nr:dephospho-CoA kinase [Cyclobacteriaceae bacterium]